jgi:hypothetical protein
LLEAVALEQADDRKDDPGDGDEAAVVERLAELGDHFDGVEPGEQPGRDRGDRNHHHRIEAKREAEDDDQDSEEREVVHEILPIEDGEGDPA